MKITIALSLFFFTLSNLVGAANFTVVEDLSELKIVTPSLSERKTAKIKLENGLEAYLISDPGVHESGAAIAVNTGSWDDPQEAPGLAHFVEHMLFMGTEKYPDEKEYHRYLDEHGGKNNAFTTNDRTVFMFSVNPEGFEGALDRFSQFFIAPLFNPSCVQRERHAVNQEFAKNVALDNWRVLHVKKELGNPEHPYNRFSIGNSATLDHLSNQDVKKWYEAHYSANLMHLVVISNLPLEKMQELVVGSFSEIKNKNLTPSHYSATLYPADLSSKLVVIAPKQQVQRLEISWEIPPSILGEKEVKADKLLSYVLGHEGEKTLLNRLQKEGLAEALSTETDRIGYGQGVFTLSVDLTTKGVADVDRVIETCFEAINTYKKSGIPAYFSEEIAALEKLGYAYQQREETFDFVTELGYSLLEEPLDTFPKKSLMPTRYDAKQVSALIDLFMPEKALYTLIAPPELAKVKMQKKEKWLDVPYALVPIAPEKIEKWKNAKASGEIALPDPNRFIPKDLKLVEKNNVEQMQILPKMEVVAGSPLGKAYFAADDRFFVPRISWTFSIKTPAVRDDVASSKAMADLWAKSLEKKLKPLGYEAELGGLSYGIEPFSGGVRLTLSGYSEKASDLLTAILKEMASFKPNAAEFALYKEELEREYHNKATKTPITEANEMLSQVLYRDFSGLNAKLRALKEVQFESFSQFSEELFKEGYLVSTFFGNVTKEESTKLFDKAVKTLAFAPFAPEKHYKVGLASLSKEQEPSYLVKRSKLPGNVVLLMIDEDAFSFKRRAALDILSKGLEEPFFTELRTKQQTAYLVSNWSQEIERHLYAFFVIQSSTHDTRDLLARFELFFETSLDNLEKEVIPKERFELIKASAIETLAHASENTETTGKLLHTLALDYDGDFSWLDQRIQGLKSLSYEEFGQYAREFLGRDNHKRLAVCVNGTLGQEGTLFYRRYTTPKKIRKEISYHGREQIQKETVSTTELPNENLK